MRRRSRRRGVENAELNITAFMNLMVILVPFLLITAVFSRITILDLYIPPASDKPLEEQLQNLEKPLVINIILREDRVDVADNKAGILRSFPKEAGVYDINGLSKMIQNMKDLVPDKTDANILVEPDIPYEALVAVMDAVRLVEVKRDGLRIQAELFPDLSIGDAPVRK